MQKQALESCFFNSLIVFFGTVFFVTSNGVFGMGSMNTNLVCTTGFNFDFHQAGLSVDFFCLKMANGMFTFCIHFNHMLATTQIFFQWSIDGIYALPLSFDQSEVVFSDARSSFITK